MVTTVRSEEKGRRILESLNPDFKARVSYVVVPDVAGDGAFDAVGEPHLTQPTIYLPQQI